MRTSGGGLIPLKKMTYAEKLRDPRWQKKRLIILKRDNFKCVYCKDVKTTLHVHHENYKNNPWDSDNEDLKTVCEHCHELTHFIETEQGWDISTFCIVEKKIQKNNLDLFYRLYTNKNVFFVFKDNGEYITNGYSIGFNSLSIINKTIQKILRKNG